MNSWSTVFFIPQGSSRRSVPMTEEEREDLGVQELAQGHRGGWCWDLNPALFAFWTCTLTRMHSVSMGFLSCWMAHTPGAHCGFALAFIHPTSICSSSWSRCWDAAVYIVLTGLPPAAKRLWGSLGGWHWPVFWELHPPQHVVCVSGAVLCRLWLSGGGTLYIGGPPGSKIMYCQWWLVGFRCLHHAILGSWWDRSHPWLGPCSCPTSCGSCWVHLRLLENWSGAHT